MKQACLEYLICFFVACQYERLYHLYYEEKIYNTFLVY